MKKEGKIITITFIALAILLIFLYINNQADSETKNVEMLTLEIGNFTSLGEDVNYYGNAEGYLAKPESPGSYPGVIMIHEWWGLNENIKDMADNLATQGYVVLAVDLYNGEVAEDSSKAGELAGAVRENPEEAIENMKAAITYLKETQEATKVASLGWCFGGQQSLQISLNEKVDATIIYYGRLETDIKTLGAIDNPILGIFGSEDTSIPISTIEDFETSLNVLGVQNDIYLYQGVGHAFANPSGSNYAPEQTEDAWMKTLDFLDMNLKG